MSDAIRLQLLAFAMRVDALVLGALGLGMLLAPRGVLDLFELGALPPGVNFILGMYGAVMFTLGVAYWQGATLPGQHLVLARIGILRAAVEIFMATYWIALGAVSIRQGAAGVFLPVWFGLAYALLYPRGGAPAPEVHNGR